MADQPTDRPDPPDLPAYLLDPLERQSPECLERVASYAETLAAWKRAQNRRKTTRTGKSTAGNSRRQIEGVASSASNARIRNTVG